MVCHLNITCQQQNRTPKVSMSKSILSHFSLFLLFIFVWGTTASSAQGLFMMLHSGITPQGAQETYLVPKIDPIQVSHM